MKYSGVFVLVVASVACTAAAPVPPMPLREKNPPAEWKVADLAARFPHPDDPGPVTVLMWEAIDFGVEDLDPVERCVAVKRFARPTLGGRTHALALLERYRTGDPAWKALAVYRTGVKPGEPSNLIGVETYPAAPSDKEIARLLDRVSWNHSLKAGVVNVRERGAPKREVQYVPKLTDGGVCRAAWKKVFDRDPPTDLFPELMLPADKK